MPASPEDTLLVVKGELVSPEGPDALDPLVEKDSTLTVTDENGRTEGVSGFGYVRTGVLAVEWVFAVAATSRSFSLHLPEGKDIDLGPLLGREDLG